LFRLTYYINEGTLDIFPYPYFLPCGGIDNMIRTWETNDFYYQLLKTRKYSLPFKGVVARFKNTGCFKEILFIERIVNDKNILLYKIQFTNQDYEENNDKYSSGYINLNNNLGYSDWRDSYDTITNKSTKSFHNQLENIILETYCHLICDFQPQRRRADALLVVSDLNNCKHYQYQPVVQYIIQEPESYSGYGKRGFDRNNYLSFLTSVEPFTRKLPVGHKASEEAIKEAKKLGYILREGETFVRPHQTTVYKKEI